MSLVYYTLQPTVQQLVSRARVKNLSTVQHWTTPVGEGLIKRSSTEQCNRQLAAKIRERERERDGIIITTPPPPHRHRLRLALYLFPNYRQG